MGNDRLLAAFEGNSERVDGFTLLPTGNVLTWGTDTSLMLWDQDGKLIKQMTGNHANPGRKNGIHGVYVLSSGRIITCASNDMCLWDQDCNLLSAPEKAQNIRILPLVDGGFIWWNSENAGILIINDNDGKRLCFTRDNGHNNGQRIGNVISLSGDRILSWALKSLIIWDKEAKKVAELKGHKSMTNGAIALPDGRMITYHGDYNSKDATVDATLYLRDSDGKVLKAMGGHTEPVTGALALTNGNIISWARDSGKNLRVWSSDGASVENLTLDKSFYCIQLLSNGSYMTNGSISLVIWDQNGKQIVNFTNPKNERFMNGYSLPDGRTLVLSPSGIWLVKEDGQLQEIIAKDGANMCEGLLLPNGNFLTREDRSATLNLWDLSNI